MDSINLKRLTIDLRKSCEFTPGPIPERFKIAIIMYYIMYGLLIMGSAYSMANVAIAKKKIACIQAAERRLMAQTKEMQAIADKTKIQIQKANRLIEWQLDNVHGQKLLHTLFCGLSKEICLKKFSFKRDLRTYQATLEIDLKGGQRELHDEFEKTLTKLDLLGLKLVMLNQSEISGGMHLKCICQVNSLQDKKR